MTQISTRLSVEGPDSKGDFELTLDDETGADWHYINREEANALIIALGGTPPQPGNLKPEE